MNFLFGHCLARPRPTSGHRGRQLVRCPLTPPLCSSDSRAVFWNDSSIWWRQPYDLNRPS
ncbi:hypothetical protein B0T14DRAFT_516027 [Immersiella caudata]|uniref:Uncharacterized protein n=1 Tax=Immersiella caudata TaxID=314043 RepID=A0AA39WXD1_9PEZI|nr:hypothetical protein B0T14DRAFT_516027 [Immersiella caudata]